MSLILVMGAAMLGASATSDTSRDCLRTHEIRNTRVLDDKTILFVMRDRKVWKNTLEGTCPSLAFYESFSYSVHNGSLCSSDWIQVFGGVSFSCGLGRFEASDPSVLKRKIKT